MSPTQQLMIEHQSIKKILNIIEEITDKIDMGTTVNNEDLGKVLEFLKIYVDKCHHSKEEKFLFPAMIESGIPAMGGIIEVLLAEHDIGRGLVKEMNSAINNSDESVNLKTFSENARSYVELVRSHIQKEDTDGFLQANEKISNQKQQELISEFNNLEKEIIGEAQHAKFEKTLEDLERIYI